jgi:hypothetical protein
MAANQTHDVTEEDATAMRMGMSQLILMMREWELMFEWIESAKRWAPVSVEKFNDAAKGEMEQKLNAADKCAGAIRHNLAGFRAEIAAVRAVVQAANAYVAPEPIAPIRVAEKAPETGKDDGEVLESSSIEGRFGDMHLIEIRKMPNGAIEEWVDGKPEKTIYDYEEQKAAKALQAATEATARLKIRNERAEFEKQENEAKAHKAARAAAAKKEAEAESRKNRYWGNYSLLQDAGSRQDDDYSAVRASEARQKEASKKWKEEYEEEARARQAEEEAEEARVNERVKRRDEEGDKRPLQAEEEAEEARVNERVKKRDEERDERARQAEKILAEQQRVEGIRADARARDAREKAALDSETPAERSARLALWARQRDAYENQRYGS